MSNQKRKYSLIYTEKNQVSFIKDRTLHLMLLLFMVLFILMAVKPVDRSQWLLGNLGAAAVIISFIPFYKRNRLSNTSYACVLAVLILHLVGSHYSYSLCPIGEWMKSIAGFNRNNYDRLVNLAFGVLASYPVIEHLYTKLRVRYIQACVLALPIILSMSTLYELIEMYTAFFLDYPKTAIMIGMQGDLWDTQKDLTACLIGAGGSIFIRILSDLKMNSRIQRIRRIK